MPYRSRSLSRPRTVKETFWSVRHITGTLQSLQRDKDQDTVETTVDWHADGGITRDDHLDETYVTAQASGHLFTTSPDAGFEEKFRFLIVNRPITILRCEFGFVGFRDGDDRRLRCDLSDPDILTMVPAAHGGVYLRVSNLKFVRVDLNADVWADAEHGNQEEFSVGHRGPSKLTLKTQEGRYLRANHSGLITADAIDQDDSVLWEFSNRAPRLPRKRVQIEES